MCYFNKDSGFLTIYLVFWGIIYNFAQNKI